LRSQHSYEEESMKDHKFLIAHNGLIVPQTVVNPS
jgi:hypothetical protein